MVRDRVLAVLHEAVPVLVLRAAVVPVRGHDRGLDRVVLRLDPHQHVVVELVLRHQNVCESDRHLRDRRAYISED